MNDPLNISPGSFVQIPRPTFFENVIAYCVNVVTVITASIWRLASSDWLFFILLFVLITLAVALVAFHGMKAVMEWWTSPSSSSSPRAGRSSTPGASSDAEVVAAPAAAAAPAADNE